MLRAWLFRPDHCSTLSNSAAIDGVFEAGTMRVASSAYFTKEFPAVTARRSQVLIINIGGPKAEPWTTLELMERSDEVVLENFVL